MPESGRGDCKQLIDQEPSHSCSHVFRHNPFLLALLMSLTYKGAMPNMTAAVARLLVDELFGITTAISRGFWVCTNRDVYCLVKTTLQCSLMLKGSAAQTLLFV